jgi:hypothetical protein
MSANKTRIAIVGAGHVAQVAHIPAYKANPEVELVAIVDYDAVKAKRIKEQFGFKAAYDDFNEMLKKADVDAVDLCTPNYLHAPMAIGRLAFGARCALRKADGAQCQGSGADGGRGGQARPHPDGRDEQSLPRRRADVAEIRGRQRAG